MRTREWVLRRTDADGVQKANDDESWHGFGDSLVTPYPPGIALLIAGEVFNGMSVDT